MLRRLYDWCIAAADRPYATWLMGIVSFVESSFFPIPPDAMLIPMAIARPDKAWFYATVCTVTSVAGGVLGYFIGAMLYDSVGLWLIQLYGYGNKVEAFREAYAQWGGWIILLKGLTPIPYKIVTIASGFAGYNLLLFVLLSIVARGMRFFLLAFLLNRYGAQARLIIEERLGFWVGAAAVERDNLARRRSVEAVLRKLLGNAQEPLTALHLRPHVLGVNAGRGPQHHEVVEQIGALAHDQIRMAVHGIHRHLDRFLGQLLRHLAAARAQQPGRPRGRGIGDPGGEDGGVETVERITHAKYRITPTCRECVNDYGQNATDAMSQRLRKA